MDIPVTADADLQQRFAHLLAQHQGIVLKVARAWSHEPEDRSDLVQEISIQAWRGFPAFAPEKARFSTWLYRVALNVAISQQRGRRLRQDHHADVAIDQLESAAMVADTPEEAAQLSQLYSVIHALPPLDRALLLLHLDDYSHQQIGEVLGISAGNAATRLHRLRQQLRQRLSPAQD
ncbi:sigma-70 family RNA polymerase sigma factor [Stenotrophomonas sp. SY1]|nr:sigma-70 family RNA polymerase sigma factor [Stenotrophomonas sp. SY1]MCD9088408.1 sigma-70 family RNA polymerase sigma factor [Stenotrophomonas sp. SY1]